MFIHRWTNFCAYRIFSPDLLFKGLLLSKFWNSRPNFCRRSHHAVPQLSTVLWIREQDKLLAVSNEAKHMKLMRKNHKLCPRMQKCQQIDYLRWFLFARAAVEMWRWTSALKGSACDIIAFWASFICISSMYTALISKLSTVNATSFSSSTTFQVKFQDF